MTPDSTKAFYRRRTILLFLAFAAPVVGLAGLWWLITNVLMVPPVPNDASRAEAVASFIMHEKGLPRLKQDRAWSVFQQQLLRIAGDPAFRERFLVAVKTASPEQQKAFRTHLFDVFKPVVMQDIERFHTRDATQRQRYLDERIVAYNRLARALGKTDLQADLSVLAPTEAEAWALLLSKTSDMDRQRGAAYFSALAKRVGEILLDPALKAEFEARIAVSEAPHLH